VKYSPFIVVLSAPSGAGKTTIAQRLVKRRKDVAFSVSATTRTPRPGEKNGKDYHFLSHAQFEELRTKDAFLECARYAGEWYGTLRSEVKRIHGLGRHVLLDIEIQGARQVREAYPAPRSIGIFVLPPTPTVLLQRLKRRKSESLESLRNRVETATTELREATSFDYVVINDELSVAVAEIEQIIDAESLRTVRNVDLSAQLQRMSTHLQRQVEILQFKMSKKVKVP
jgi:guanylate kinase